MIKIYIFLIYFIFICFSCTKESPDENKMLAVKHCSSCHLFPSPELLPKSIWKENVLPQMAWRLGISSSEINPLKGLSFMEQQIILEANLIPSSPLLKEEEWQKIVDFYIFNAPDTVTLPSIKPELQQNLPLFKPKNIIELKSSALSTLIHWDNFSKTIWLGTENKQLYQINTSGEILKSYSASSTPSWINTTSDSTLLATIIGFMHPNDLPIGKLISVENHKNPKVLLDSLRRPVHTSVADMNEDGIEDIIICEFGNHLGGLTLIDGNTLQKQILSTLPGAYKAKIKDLNKNGQPDILAMFGQGKEGIYAFYNQGENQFRQEQILAFHPGFGSSDFELINLDGDDKLEILYTNGDNADYSVCLKAYHGVRIFKLNDKGDYTEVYFYPMYGASKLCAEDFDLDGDIDIAVISFFPDFKTTYPESFVYLENRSKEKMDFKPFTLPESKDGRWLVMDSGDIDEDGDIDILLGSFSSKVNPAPATLQKHWQEKQVHGLILENTTH